MVYFFLFILFSGCGAEMGSSLLSSGAKPCDPVFSKCNENSNPTELGALEIQAHSSSLTMNIDQSDTVEITGTCKDLGRKKNRIIVEVFAGDLDETVDPYISNSIMSNCYNLAQSGKTSSGINFGERCFWVTKGTGLIEGLATDQKDFPQCHNGQFGFSVRLGKVLTNTALGTNYLARFKLRTEEGGISDSMWSRVIISRKISPPRIDSATKNGNLFQCHLKNSVARFNPFISYTLNRSFNLFNGAATGLAPRPDFSGIFTNDPKAFEYFDNNLVEGVKYNYTLTASEAQYLADYAPAPVPFATSAEVSCELDPPILQPLMPDTSGRCSFSLAYANFVPGVRYHLGVSEAKDWSKNPLTMPNTATCAAGSGFVSDGFVNPPCHINGLTPGKTYYFAVRAYMDSNPANANADVATEEVGKWSGEVSCRPP